MLPPPVDRSSVIPLAGLCVASSVCMCDLVCVRGLCLRAMLVKRARESFLFIVLVARFHLLRIFSYLCHISTLMSELKVHRSLKSLKYHPTKIASVTGLH